MDALSYAQKKRLSTGTYSQADIRALDAALANRGLTNRLVAAELEKNARQMAKLQLARRSHANRYAKMLAKLSPEGQALL